MSSIYRIFTIYKCQNKINGKCYIGFDSNWPNRQKAHQRSYQNPKKHTKFYNALKKYGWSNFQWEVIYQAKEWCDNAKKSHTLNFMETHFIKQYDSVENGYNTSFGGDCGPICKGSKNGMWNKTHSLEVKQKLSNLAKTLFKGKTYEELYGKEKSDQLKHIRSQKAKGKNHKHKNNPRFDNTTYTFYNIKTGIIIHCDRYTFYQNYKINKSGVCCMINRMSVYKDWCILV